MRPRNNEETFSDDTICRMYKGLFRSHFYNFVHTKETNTANVGILHDLYYKKQHHNDGLLFIDVISMDRKPNGDMDIIAYKIFTNEISEDEFYYSVNNDINRYKEIMKKYCTIEHIHFTNE